LVVKIALPAAMSNTRKRGSFKNQLKSLTAALVPSGLSVTETLELRSHGNSLRTRAVTTSQTRRNVSWLHTVSSQVPSGLKANPSTVLGWSKVAHRSPVAASRTRTVLSQLPVASHWPSGL